MTAYQQAMRAPGRELAVSGKMTLHTGREIALTGADVISLNIDEGVNDGLLVGAVLSAKHTLKLAGAGGAWLPGGDKLSSDAVLGATVQLSIGTGALVEPLCTFVVREAEAEKYGAGITLSGYDSMYEETGGAFSDTLAYPATLTAVVRHIVGKTRYALPDSVPGGSAQIPAKPQWGTCNVRQALGWALALTGCYARISRAGTFEIHSVWETEDIAENIADAAVLSRSYGFADFGPLKVLRATSVRGQDSEAEAEALEVMAAGVTTATSQNALDLGANPLLIAGTEQAQTLLSGALAQLEGMQLRRAAFRFRGDPTLCVGARVSVDGTTSLLTRQKLRLAKGFSAECEMGAPDPSDNNLRAITPEGGLNAARLTGTVDGGLLAAESVTAGAIRAGSITAAKLAAGAVDAQAISAVSARVAELAAQQISTDALYAGIAQIAGAHLGQAVIDGAQIQDATITGAKIQNAAIDGTKIANAAIDSAKIALGAITTALIASGAVGTAQIADGSITSAKIVSLNADVITAGTLSVDRLLLKGANGLFRAINATDEGLTVEQLSQEEYQNAISGTVLTARSVTADKLAAKSVTANEIAAGTITAAEVDVSGLFASEAAVGILNAYDIRNDDCITLTVGGERRTFLRVRAEGVEIGSENSDYKLLLRSDRLDILQTGQVIASFAYNRLWTQAAEIDDYLKVGAYTIRKSSDGGLAFGT